MADETREILIDVQFENQNIDKEVGDLNEQLRKNREAIKELSKDYSQNSEEIAKLEAENRQLSASKRDLIKQSQTEANSINALRQRVAQLTKERNSLDLSTKEGQERLAELNSELLENVEALKSAEEAGGDFRRNVGNYTSGLKDAVGGVRILGTSLGALSKALLTNPIGLLISSLTALVALFSRTQTGIELFQKASSALGTIVGKLSDVVESLAGNIIAAFEDPQQAIKDFGNLIVQNIVNRFNAVLDLGRGLVELFQNLFRGEFNAALDSLIGLGESALTAATGIKDLGATIAEFAVEVAQATNEAFGLEEQLIANTKAIADQQVAVAQSILAQKELNLTIEDVNATFEDRIAAAEEFQRVEEEQITRSLELARERLEILKDQNDLTNSTEEDIQRVRDAEIELANLEAASFERRLTNQNKLNAIRLAQEAERQKAIDDGRAAEEAFAEEQVKKAEQRDKEEAQRVEKLKQLRIKSEQEAVASVGQIFEQGTAASKGFALAQIAFDTGKAISALTAASEGNPANAFTFGGAGVAQFIAGLARIGANIASAKRVLASGDAAVSSVSSASAGGGGQAQPVAISQELSNVNASLLSQFGADARSNQAQTDAINEAVANMAPPQVAVVDINRGQNRREVKVQEASLGG